MYSKIHTTEKKKLTKGDLLQREQLMHRSWCNKNDIKIYMVPIGQVLCNIVVDDKGKIYRDPEHYRQDNKLQRKRRKKGEPKPKIVSERIAELYTTKYFEYNEKKEDNS